MRKASEASMRVRWPDFYLELRNLGELSCLHVEPPTRTVFCFCCDRSVVEFDQPKYAGGARQANFELLARDISYRSNPNSQETLGTIDPEIRGEHGRRLPVDVSHPLIVRVRIAGPVGLIESVFVDVRLDLNGRYRRHGPWPRIGRLIALRSSGTNLLIKLERLELGLQKSASLRAQVFGLELLLQLDNQFSMWVTFVRFGGRYLLNRDCEHKQRHGSYPTEQS